MKLNGQGCYRIKKWVFWGMVLLFITLITMVGQKEKIREKWLHSQRRVDVSFEGEKSELKDISTCYLCGLNNESLMGVFQGSDDIGIISLLDWYIVELRLDSYKDSKGSQITRSEERRVGK